MRKYIIAGLLLVCMTAYGAMRLGDSDITVDGTTFGNTTAGGDITFDPGSGGLIFNDNTASTVPYLDASKVMTSSAVTPTELNLLSGVTSLLTESNTATFTNKTYDADGTGNSITNIENADIKAGAAILLNKLAAVTVSRALVSDASGFVTPSTVTSTELALLSGVTGPLMTESSTATFTNKTYDADGTGNSLTNIEDANIKAAAAIDATKIADGTVTSTEFQYIGGLTSDAQTQLTAKADTDLNNLTTTAINQSLLPSGSRTLGTFAAPWAGLSINSSGKVSMQDAGGNSLLIDGNFTGGSGFTDAGDGGIYTANGNDLLIMTSDLGAGGNSGNLAIETEDDTDGNSGSMLFKSGDTTFGNSGNLTWETGTAAGTRGKLSMIDGSEGVINECWVSSGVSGEGNWATCPGGGGGAGGVTYWSDFQADDITKVKEDSDYTTYAGTPDNVATNLSITSETTNPLSGDASYLLTKAAADASGEAWILPMENPDDAGSNTPDRLCTNGGETQYVTFKYETSANYDNSADEKLLVYTYGDSSGLQACSARNILSNSFSNALPVAGSGGQYQCSFTCDASDTQLDAVLAYSGTASNAVTIKADLVTFGPDATVTGPIHTARQTWTPTGSWTSNTVYTGSWTRDGEYMIMTVKVLSSGTPNAVNLEVDLPPGYTIDDSKLLNPSTLYYYTNSFVSILDFDVNWYNGRVRYVDTTSVGLHYLLTDVTISPISSTAPGTKATGDYTHFEVRLPIVEFGSGNAMMSTTQVDHSTISASTAGVTPTGTVAGAYNTIIFGTVDDDDHGTYNTTSGVWTAPMSGEIDISVGVSYSNAAAGGGAWIVRTINTTTGKFFLGVVEAVGVASARFVSGSGTLVVSAGDTIEFQSLVTVSTPAFSGSEAHFSIAYRPDFSTFSVYGKYEEITATGAIGTYSVTAGQWGDFTSFILTPGTWSCWANSYWNSNGAVTTRNVLMGIGTTSGNTSPGTAGLDYFGTNKVTTTSEIDQVYFRKSDINVTSTTTYYLKSLAETSITNLDAGYTMACGRKK